MTQESASGKQSKIPIIISISILLGIIISYFTISDFQSFIDESYNVLTSQNEKRISTWVNDLGLWGPVFIAGTMVLQMFLIVIPSPLLMVVSVLAYGPVLGAGLAILSIFLASSVGYFIGRYLGEITVDRIIGHKKEQKLAFYVEKFGIWAVIITRLSPLFSNDAVSFVGGILKMGYWKFISATLVGITPLAVLIAYFGESNQRLKVGLIILTAVSLLALIIYIIYDRKKKEN